MSLLALWFVIASFVITRTVNLVWFILNIKITKKMNALNHQFDWIVLTSVWLIYTNFNKFSQSLHYTVNSFFYYYYWILQFYPCFPHCGNHSPHLFKPKLFHNQISMQICHEAQAKCHVIKKKKNFTEHFHSTYIDIHGCKHILDQARTQI